MIRKCAGVALAVLALLVAGCDLRTATPQGPGPLRYRDEIFSTVTKTADITYGSAPNQAGQTVTLKLDVYRPDGDAVTTRPTVIFVHGGSFRSGNKTSAEIVDEATVAAKKGFVAASISYRLSPNGCTSVTAECVTAIRDAKHDAQAAVRFLRANAATYGLDTSRIAMAGTSAGAITALEVAYGSDDVGTSGNPGFPSTVRAAVSLSGAKVLTTADPGEPAALLFHGTSDAVVPYQWATNTVTAARDAGLTIEITAWTGDGHVPYVAHRDQILTETANFLWWTMNLKAAAT